MPAIQSSAMMPHPPGSFSSWRTGKGFQISNKRKSTNPSKQIFPVHEAQREENSVGRKIHVLCQMRQRNGNQAAAINVRCCPATSSITTNCGSFIPENSAAREALHTPMPPESPTSPRAQTSGSSKRGIVDVAAGNKKMIVREHSIRKGCKEKDPRIEVGCRKNIAESMAVSDPYKRAERARSLRQITHAEHSRDRHRQSRVFSAALSRRGNFSGWCHRACGTP